MDAFQRLLEMMKQCALFLLAGMLAAQTPTSKSFVGTVAGFRPESAGVEIRPDQGEKVVGSRKRKRLNFRQAAKVRAEERGSSDAGQAGLPQLLAKSRHSRAIPQAEVYPCDKGLTGWIQIQNAFLTSKRFDPGGEGLYIRMNRLCFEDRAEEEQKPLHESTQEIAEGVKSILALPALAQ